MAARCQILAEWKEEISQAIDTTHAKLAELGKAKVRSDPLGISMKRKVFPMNV